MYAQIKQKHYMTVDFDVSGQQGVFPPETAILWIEYLFLSRSNFT